MCGIIGGVSERDISEDLIKGLYHLEYRGYDSAGIAYLDSNHNLQRIRTKGKVNVLEQALDQSGTAINLGIAHTRWATHGKPSESNAHPHISNDAIAIVHNGIIENHEIIKASLVAQGYIFTSETDSEVAAHLIHLHMQATPSLLQAVQAAAREMLGAFSLGVLHKDFPKELVALRQGSPLIIALGNNENFIASDALAVKGFASEVIYLQEGESARLTYDAVAVFDKNGQPIVHSKYGLNTDFNEVSKEPYRHFMLKEIFEQDLALAETLEGRVTSLNALKASFGHEACAVFAKVKHIHIVACGTSYHAGLIAKYWLESLAGIASSVEIASEYRYRDVVVPQHTLFIAISQSGETADTLAALYKAKTMDYLASLAICNVATSTLVRESNLVFLTRAGVEIGVASTKAFTTQLAALLMLAATLCHDERAQVVLQQLQQLPNCVKSVLSLNATIKDFAKIFVNKMHALFLGRGVHYPVAMEGALKLKEISYIHAEAYPAGELKHGPLALVDSDMPVIAIAPDDELLDKLKSNLQTVSARGGQLVVFIADTHIWPVEGIYFIQVPHCASWISPIVYTIPLQLLSYHVAIAKGTDVDQPRNLAKSVTVE